MSKTKTTETSSKENSKNEDIKSSSTATIGNLNDEAKTEILKERKRIKKASKKPITKAKPTIADKIKQLDKQGFDHNRIAAMLMIQKSLVKQVLK